MTGQSLLDRMELFNPELQLQTGEVDVTRGLLALNIAQDYYESLAATRKGIKGGQIGTVVTALNTESTAFPTGVLRLDKLSMINSSTSRPKWDLDPIQTVGGHAPSGAWPGSAFAPSSGEPTAYWTDGSNIYWDPLPSGAYTVRWYGWQRVTDITASGTFLYDDIVSLPMAAFAVRILKAGLDDDALDTAKLAQEFFKSTLDTLEGFNRTGAAGFEYTYSHTT